MADDEKEEESPESERSNGHGGNRGAFTLIHEPAQAESEEEFEVEGNAELADLPELKRAESAPSKLDAEKVVEAALFLGNREFPLAELALVANTTVKRAGELVERIQRRYNESGSPIELVFENGKAAMQVRPAYISAVAKLSKQTELSRKATRILALIAKKKELLQSELKRYFRGEIYEYVTELKVAGYVTSEKKGLTRLLKPTKKFYETFQVGA